jgi:uncharacterized protein GlcG (DUF336 family)
LISTRINWHGIVTLFMHLLKTWLCWKETTLMNIMKSLPGSMKTSFAAIPVMMALAFGMASTMAFAEELPRETFLPVALATKAATAAMEKCKADGYRVSVAVVGRSGRVKALLRGDGAGPHTLNSSRKKAFTAASMRRPTSEFAQLITQMPAIQGLRDMDPDILILGGGLPIIIEGDFVGGIGVGGAPGGHLDDACAEAGLKSIGAAIQSPKKK